MNLSLIKQNIRYIWLFLIICLLGYNFYNPIFFGKENIVNVLNQYEGCGLLILFLLHLFRGFTMLPPTLLIFAGVIMYPDRLFELLIVSVAGSVLSGALSYHFSKKMDFKVWLKKHKATYDKIKNGLNSKYGSLFIIGWVLFPFVPTDIIGYTAGATRTSFTTYLIAYFFGKMLLCTIYIYGGEFILENLFNFGS
ncbi:MAG: VTT domain-containing protein [Saprospiraceae bacterium]